MARSHALIRCHIWDDPEFRALSVEAQRGYLLLLSQRKLSIAGVMSYTPTAWSRGCDATSAADVNRFIAELTGAGFVLLDPSTEELLIRTLVKHDPPRGAKSITALWRAWDAIDSELLRRAVVAAVPAEVWSWPDVEHPAAVLAIRDELRNAPSDAPSAHAQAVAAGHPSVVDTATAKHLENAPSDTPSDGTRARAHAPPPPTSHLPPTTGHLPLAPTGRRLSSSPQPSSSTTAPSSSATPSPPNPPYARDPLFDALADACGYEYAEMTERQRKACGVARAQLVKVGATPDEIHRRAGIYTRKHPQAALTPNALANQWAALKNGPDPVDVTPRLSPSMAAVVRAAERRTNPEG